MNLSKREMEALIGTGMQYRSQNMWTHSTTIPENLKEETMNNDSKEIIDLGRLHGKEDLAMNAVSDGISLHDFRKELLELNSSASLSLPKSDDLNARTFDIDKAFNEHIEGKEISGYEGEVQQELKRSRPLSGTNSFYIPSVRALGSSAPLSSLNVQDVVQSGQQTDLYQALGLSMYNIADGRARIPSETDLAVAQTVDFDGSNSANDVAPTYSAIDLVPSSVVAFCSVSRNLTNRQSVGVEQVLGNSLSRSLGSELENQIFGGSGSHPNFQGILNASVNQETYSSAPNFEDIRNSIQHVMDDGYSTNNAKFVVTPAFFNSLQAISKDSGSGAFLLEPSYDPARPFVRGQMCGYDVMVSSKISAGHMVFGDFSKYALAMFSGIEILVDNNYEFNKQNYGVMAILDAAGAVMQPKAFTEILSA